MQHASMQRASADIHPAVRELLGFFEYGHLPEDSLARTISQRCGETAWELAIRLSLPLHQSDHPAELTAGIRKLLEAKDCLVRAALPPHTG